MGKLDAVPLLVELELSVDEMTQRLNLSPLTGSAIGITADWIIACARVAIEIIYIIFNTVSKIGCAAGGSRAELVGIQNHSSTRVINSSAAGSSSVATKVALCDGGLGR